MNHVALAFSLSLALSAPFALVACGDDSGGVGGGGGTGGGDSSRPTCDALGEICHDTQTTLGQECHELGHDEANTEDDCKAREAECLAECQGGGTTSSNASSGSASSGSAASTGTGG
jgi:hypothetical protein